MLDRLAARLGDAIDFQVDIFWVAVGGADRRRSSTRLGERVVSLHVKDGVELPAGAYGAEPFVNVPAGEGVVDPAPAIAAAEAAAVGRVAHRRVRPRRRGRRSTPPDAATTTWSSAAWRAGAARDERPIRAPARVGIVGCGNVTDLYLPGMRAVPDHRAGGLRRPRRSSAAEAWPRGAASRPWPSTRSSPTRPSRSCSS